MMTVLLVFKLLSLFFEGVTWFNVQSHGSPVGWNVLYYIFAFLKGIFLFVVVLLVGTGWSLLKVRWPYRCRCRVVAASYRRLMSTRACFTQPFLNDREKKILVIVLSLQVVDNIAIIVVAEMAPGSVAFGRWVRAVRGCTAMRYVCVCVCCILVTVPLLCCILQGDLLHLVDIICCCAVLLPIVWSIRHLRQAAGADGKGVYCVGRGVVVANLTSLFTRVQPATRSHG